MSLYPNYRQVLELKSLIERVKSTLLRYVRTGYFQRPVAHQEVPIPTYLFL